MHQSQRVHYALVNSQHQVRSLVLKADSKAYLNSSSIIANVHSSDTYIAKVTIETDFTSAIQTGVYAKRVITFMNQTGRVTLKSDLNAYINSLVQ